MPKKKAGKRAAGEGLLRERIDGRWEARVYASLLFVPAARSVKDYTMDVQNVSLRYGNKSPSPPVAAITMWADGRHRVINDKVLKPALVLTNGGRSNY